MKVLHLLIPLAVLCLCQGQQNSPSKVTAFWLVNVDVLTYVRKLTTNSVVSVPFNYTIVAAAEPFNLVPTVVFTRPFRRVDKKAPFGLTKSLGKDDNFSSSFEPLRLEEGSYQISAFPKGNKAGRYTISNVKINPPIGPAPPRGPLPSEVKPDVSIIDIQAPQKVSSCSIPRITSFDDWGPFIRDPSFYTLGVTLDYCSNTNIRRRIIEYEIKPVQNGEPVVRTKVLQAEIVQDSSGQVVTFIRDEFCDSKNIFVEYCVLNEANEELCTTSPIVTLPGDGPAEPRLAFRPPIRLDLAPKDRVTIPMEIGQWPDQSKLLFDGFFNGRQIGRGRFKLQAVVERRDGTVGVTPGVVGTKVSISIPFQGGGVTRKDNKAKVYLQFTPQDCPTRFSTFQQRYATEVIVDKNTSPLIKQDTKLPDFSQPVFPTTVIGTPATITVEAANNGGGMRKDGSKTKLTYQWYKRSQSRPFQEDFAEPIPGATNKSLFIAEATCDTGSLGCGRSGCFGFERYFVDVCNTYGCRRSDVILPNVVAAPGQDLPEICKFASMSP